MAGRKNDGVRIIRVRKGATLKEIYAKVKKAFTAADLAKFTDLDEPTVPAREVLEKLEALDRQDEERKKQKPKRKRSK